MAMNVNEFNLNDDLKGEIQRRLQKKFNSIVKFYILIFNI